MSIESGKSKQLKWLKQLRLNNINKIITPFFAPNSFLACLVENESMMRLFSFLVIFFACWVFPKAQDVAPSTEYVRMQGTWVRAVIQDGDTLIVQDIDMLTISAPRTFASVEEERLYNKYKRYAAKVYPYAKKAIKIFKETEYVTRHMKKKKRKKHIKALQKELNTDFKDELKKLTKTQGKILLKMIEKETDNNMYDLVKGLRNGITARYWQTLAKFNGYNLKDGYTRGEDKMMDIILDDLDVSYQLPVAE